MIVQMLTTTDNEFDPFTQFDAWDARDRELGHYTCSLLAREAMLSQDQSVADEDESIENAIAVIIQENLSGKHRVVTKTLDA